MEIYIIRHGQTKWNRAHRLQGRADIELNERGRELAGITGRALKHTPFDVFYSSPLIRAYETACLVRGYRNIPIIRDERLMELHFGADEGKCADDLTADPAHPFRYFFSEPERYTPPAQGESFEHICTRAKEFMQQVVEPMQEQYERILIAGHGALNKAILCHVKQHGIEQYWDGGLQKNCSIIVVRLEHGRYEVLDENRIYY